MPKYIKWDNEYYIRAYSYDEIRSYLTPNDTIKTINFSGVTVKDRYRESTAMTLNLTVPYTEHYVYDIPFNPPFLHSGAAVNISTNNTLAPYLKFDISQNRATSSDGTWANVINTPGGAWVSRDNTTGSSGQSIINEQMYNYFINNLNPASGFKSLINAWLNDTEYSTADNYIRNNKLAIILAQISENGDYSIFMLGNNKWISGAQGGTYKASYIKLIAVTTNNNPNPQGIPISTDPYIEIIGGASTIGGGDGNGDFTDETIDEPTTPTISGLNSGFISAYSPSIGQLNALASYMWTSDFITNLNKVFGDNPMGTILGLSAIPVAPTTGSSQNVILGNVDTEIEMPVITSQYVKFNCGSINIQPKYGAFLDYEPYTSIDLFLPYIGLVQLSTNDVMGKSLAVTYTIDVLSGACVANVACGGTIMYTFEGACATQFPVTNNDYSNMFKAAIDAASSIVGAIGGAVASGMTGNVAGAVGAIADGMAGAAQAAMNAHPVVNRSGSLSGSAGLMGIQKPFIVWTTPNMVASNNQNSFIGYPNFITTSLSSLSGYTEVENINLGIAGATSEEVNEIKTLLRNGVIF